MTEWGGTKQSQTKPRRAEQVIYKDALSNTIGV